MARKDVLRHLLVKGQSLSASFNSQPTMITFLDNCSYQINVMTTDSTGTFTVQGSDDYQANTDGSTTPNAGQWVTLPLGGPTPNPVVAAANDTILINMNQLPFNALRLVYTSTIAGTGTADIYIVDKQIGG